MRASSSDANSNHRQGAHAGIVSHFGERIAIPHRRRAGKRAQRRAMCDRLSTGAVAARSTSSWHRECFAAVSCLTSRTGCEAPSLATYSSFWRRGDETLSDCAAKRAAPLRRLAGLGETANSSERYRRRGSHLRLRRKQARPSFKRQLIPYSARTGRPTTLRRELFHEDIELCLLERQSTAGAEMETRRFREQA